MRPVLLRLQSAAPCPPETVAQVEALATRVQALPAKSGLRTADAAAQHRMFLVSGWACRHIDLADGRKQIIDLIVPGDGLGVRLRPTPIADVAITALTPVRLVDAGPLLQPERLATQPELRQALEAQADAQEHRLLSQTVRLGRMTALERLAHLFLELHERLAAVELGDADAFPCPLTQEALADTAGLSVVHVNRTLQELKRRHLVSLERGSVRLLDRSSLQKMLS